MKRIHILKCFQNGGRPQQVKHGMTTGSSNSTPRYATKISENRCANKSPYMNYYVHQMNILNKMGAGAYNTIFFSHEGE